MIQVLDQIDPRVQEEVREFIAHLPADRGACAEHDPRWLIVLRQSLRHQPLLVVARGSSSGPVRGCLPLALVQSRLFGRFLVSLPYLNRAGVAAEDDAAAQAILERAVELAHQHRVRYLELRHHEYLLTHPALAHQRADKVRMVLELPSDAETLWRGFDAKVRNQVRKGEKAGLTIRWGGVELLDAFYHVLAVNMRDLGTPVYPRRLFASILTLFTGQAELAVVEYQGQPAAGALLVHQPELAGGLTQVPSASSLRRLNATNANMWMYHQLLVRAIERGSRAFDFGRSSQDSGTYRFKKQWGAQPRPTVWQYHLRCGEAAILRPDQPRYQRKIQTWKRLPVWLTRLAGPAIVRGIP
ncbi:MAG TPA: FemAB family XrtA/PEP-CTERM system-associated protein [Phycisphaeraceae bacterium]